MNRYLCLMFLAGACGRSLPVAVERHDVAETLPALHERATTADIPCNTGKLTFTRDSGCRNDGSVEFCLPKGDSALEARALGIAPGILVSGGGGRAGCDLQSETLYRYPTRGPSTCLVTYGRLTDAAWSELCQLAALPEIRAIVPTWYE